MAKKKKPNKKQFTKSLVKVVITVSIINGTLPFILSFFGRDPVAELGGVWVGSILLTVVTYCTKAYWETRSERKQDLEDFKNGFFEEDTDGESDTDCPG